MKKKESDYEKKFLDKSTEYAEDLRENFHEDQDHFFMRLGLVVHTLYTLAENLQKVQDVLSKMIENSND